MGEVVLAAKITHVPSIWLSEHDPRFSGIRSNAISGLQEIGRRARARGADTFLIFDTHWLVNQGFHVNAHSRLCGRFTSHELPHFLYDLEYDYLGDPELSQLLSEEGQREGISVRSHNVEGLGVEYGTLIPMHHMNADAKLRVLSVAANQRASIDEGRAFGALVARAIRKSPRKVAVLASGSLSHDFWPNALSADGLNSVNTEFNRQVDLHVLDLWQTGRINEFLKMLPEYAVRCYGEASMIDTAHLFGVLGWDQYRGRGEIIGEYFGSSGTGQCNVDFSLTEIAKP